MPSPTSGRVGRSPSTRPGSTTPSRSRSSTRVACRARSGPRACRWSSQRWRPEVERLLLGALQGALSGVLLGGVYGLIAIGLAMVIGVMRIVNFAHADFVMLAMYITFFVVTVGGLDPYLAVVLAIPALFLLGLVLERGIIRFSYGQAEANQLVLTAAISLLLQNLALLLFSPTARSAVTSYELIPLGPVFVNKAQVF